MNFLRMELENFKSFSGKHEIEFAQNGLHFITGENIIEPNLGANGAGKSTIFDAIFWCLYGKSLRNLKASNIRNWNTDDTVSVRVFLNFSRTEYGSNVEIVRTWAPNSLSIRKEDGELEPVTQEDILRLIKLNEEEFQNSIIVGQFSQMFFDMQPAQKLSLFSGLLDLDQWVDLSQKASTKCKELNKEIDFTSNKSSEVEGRINELEGMNKDLKESAEDFEDEIEDCLNVIHDRIKDGENEYNRVEGKIVDIKKLLKEENSRHKKLDKEYGIIKDSLESSLKCINVAELEVSLIRNKIKELKTQKSKFEDMEGTCIRCNQKITEEHIYIETEVIKSEVRKELKKLDLEEENFYVLSDDYEELLTKKNKIDSKLDKSFRIVREHEIELGRMEHFLKGKYDDITRMRNEFKTTKEKENPYDSMIEENKVRLGELSVTLTELQKEKEKLHEENNSYGYWIIGFKELRLFIIKRTLDLLEVEVNNNLLQLGLDGWSVSFDVEKDTKSGGVSKGFHVFVKSPSNSDSVPWESWSGGEGQRLRLAGTLGLANLILNRKGIESSLEVFDEPSAHLSQNGIEALLDLLYSRARDTGKALYLVDHRSIEYGGFDSTLVVRKDEQGSSLQGSI